MGLDLLFLPFTVHPLFLGILILFIFWVQSILIFVNSKKVSSCSLGGFFVVVVVFAFILVVAVALTDLASYFAFGVILKAGEWPTNTVSFPYYYYYFPAIPQQAPQKKQAERSRALGNSQPKWGLIRNSTSYRYSHDLSKLDIKKNYEKIRVLRYQNHCKIQDPVWWEIQIWKIWEMKSLIAQRPCRKPSLKWEISLESLLSLEPMKANFKKQHPRVHLPRKSK